MRKTVESVCGLTHSVLIHGFLGSKRFQIWSTHFSSNQMIEQIGSEVFGKKLISCTTLFGDLRFVPKNEGSGGGWHQDSMFFEYKAFLYLTDVDENNGPLALVPDTNKLLTKLYLQFFRRTKPMSLKYSQQDAELCEKKVCSAFNPIVGKAGTLILADTSCLHAGFLSKRVIVWFSQTTSTLTMTTY